MEGIVWQGVQIIVGVAIVFDDQVVHDTRRVPAWVRRNATCADRHKFFIGNIVNVHKCSVLTVFSSRPKLPSVRADKLSGMNKTRTTEQYTNVDSLISSKNT